MAVYYNEFDPRAAAWLRELIKEKLIPDGVVDESSIVDVNPYELTGYTQHHFFAGIGGWPYALRLAGWPDDQPVVTASCPCQPFSAAGKQLGEKDERHLWPVFRDVLTHLKAPIAFGEQVASAAGRAWLAGVRADLEGLGYAVGAADLCAAGVGAPHVRQRIYWMGNASGAGRGRNAGAIPGAQTSRDRKGRETRSVDHQSVDAGNFGGLVDANNMHTGHAGNPGSQEGSRLQPGANASRSSRPRRLSHTSSDMGDGRQHEPERRSQGRDADWSDDAWGDYRVIQCRDGKARRIESALSPLVDGFPERVGLLRGFGNAIVPELAAQFIQASVEAIA